jgi:hypothetical protein
MSDDRFAPPTAEVLMPVVAPQVPDAIRKKIRLAWGAGLVSAAVTLIFVLIAVSGTSLLGFGLAQLLDVAVILGLSFGIYREEPCLRGTDAALLHLFQVPDDAHRRYQRWQRVHFAALPLFLRTGRHRHLRVPQTPQAEGALSVGALGTVSRATYAPAPDTESETQPMTTPSIPATLIPGDGIGPEIVDATLAALDALKAPFTWDTQIAGLGGVKASGDPLPQATLDSIRRTRLALKGPLETPSGGGYRSSNVRLREEFQLYANLRPARTIIPGGRFDKIDLVVVRENLEGL